MARHPRADSTGRTGAEAGRKPFPRPADCRRRAPRSDVPGRDVEDVPPRPDGARGDGARAGHVRPPRPEPPDRGVRPSDPALQGVRLDGDAALSLAVLVLCQSRDGPGPRLDERDLPTMGRGARYHDRHAGLLVPGAMRAEADDGPARLRRRRESRSDDDAWEEAGGGQGARIERMAVPPSSQGPPLLGRRPW